MFGHNKKTVSVVDKVEKGDLSVEDAQKMLSVRHLEAQVIQTEQKARNQTSLVDLRNTWGRVILGILIATIVSDFFLIFMVGTGTWQFTNNTYFLNVVITEHLVQIFGLVIIVLKSLFPTEKNNE